MSEDTRTVFEDPFSESVWRDTYKDHSDETVDDTMRRVARFVASAEHTIKKKKIWEDLFYEALSGFKITAGGRIYSNAGTEWAGTTLMNCFSPNTQVLTNEGYQDICDIEVGDVVLTHKGQWKPVVNVLERKYEGDIYRLSSHLFTDDILSTPEHPFYAGDDNWEKCEVLNHITLACRKVSSVVGAVIDLADFFEKEIRSGYVVVNENTLHTTKAAIGGNGAKLTVTGAPVNRYVTLDVDIAYLLGRFAGDGSTFKQNKKDSLARTGFSIVFSNKETKELERCKDIVSRIFGIDARVNTAKTQDCVYLRKHSAIVAMFLYRLIGGGFQSKQIPNVIWEADNEIQRSFLYGLFDADGIVHKRGGVGIILANEQLIDSVQVLCIMNDIPIVKRQFIKETTHNKAAYGLYAGAHYGSILRENLSKHYDDDRLKHTVLQSPTNLLTVSRKGELTTNRFSKTKEQYSGYVYNLSVADDESYVVNNVVVHNCFVSPRGDYDIDSLKHIMHDLYCQVQTLKSEGGWGENFSYIRPRGAFIHGIGVETPGAVKYMEMFDRTSDVITSGAGVKSQNKKAKGKIRKGAMMGVVDCWHPDIIEFITAKQQPGRLTKFNVSVNCTDEFMNKVLRVTEMRKALETKIPPQGYDYVPSEDQIEEEDKWNLRFPETTHRRYKTQWTGDIRKWESMNLPVKGYKTVSATWLWDLIMESTYNRAEPGVLFLDRANYFNPLNYKETIYATNPCGEQTLAPGGVCNLGSINLTQFVSEDQKGFDLDCIRRHVRILVRFLDNINSLSNAPLEEYEHSMRNKRRIGCGILGWGSALYMLKVPFGSSKAGSIRDEVMGAIAREAYRASIDLAVEKGMFSECVPTEHVKNPFIKRLGLEPEYINKLNDTGIRNSSLLSIQPTGNSSIFANVASGGLEPVFLPEYVRTVIVNHMPEHIADVTPKWYEGEWKETKMFKFAKEGDEEILRGRDKDGVVYKIDRNRGLTKEVLCEDYGVRWLKARNQWRPKAGWAKTTADLTVQEHVNDLIGFAKWVDSAMSKTINIPNDYPFEDFKNVYLETYRSKVVKGVTTYRAGTMTTVLAAKDEQDASASDEEIIVDDIKLPTQSPSITNIIRAENRKWYLTVIMNEQQTRPFALFVHTNHPEKGVTTHDAVERLIELAYEKGIPKQWIEDTEKKIQQDNNATKITRAISLLLRHGVLIKNIVAVLDNIEDVFVGTFLFQIKKFLLGYVRDGEKAPNGTCPSCQAVDSFIYSEGCIKCKSCGYSKCG